jgi:dihydrolipoamide dehydrogenase
MTTMIVIGGGPAGMTAALEGARHGAQVTLVSSEPVGGRATWHSLVPSKVLLTAADHLGEAAHNPALGLTGAPPEPDLAVLRDRIADQARAWHRHSLSLLADRGVGIVSATARFLDPHRVELTREGADAGTMLFDKAVIATGSVPVFLPNIKPDGKRVLAPRLAGKLAEFPAHMIVVGGGVTGAEFVYFFNRAGANVTWVTDLPRILPRVDPDLSDALGQTLSARGVTLMTSAPVEAVRPQADGVVVALKDGRSLAGSHAFLAIGRRADLGDLALEAAGVDRTAEGIATDAFGRTSQAHIYAVGDVTGAPFIANRGQAQARVAARHASGAETAGFRPETIVEAVYTAPQLAVVGLGEAAATAMGRPVEVFRAECDEALKPRLAEATEGFVKILCDAEDGRIVGGAACCDRAAEVLAPIAVAIAGGTTFETLAAVFPAYPTLSELPGIAVRGY